MPIRFRCAYCNQLLGIARRKVGTVIRCPTCAGQVVVPQSEGAEKRTGPVEQPLFERSDFGDVFNAPAAAGAGAHAAPSAPPPAGAWGTHDEPPFDVERVSPGGFAPSVTSQVPGIFLSPGKATLLTVLIVVFIAVAFGLGILVGRAF